jgi:DNA polymerase-3 subunit gamma/tau
MFELDKAYRPQIFDKIIGQDIVVNALKESFANNEVPHVFLFTGNSGVGKTTIARVIANKLQCDIIEVDAASFTGIDDARMIADNLKFRSLSGNGKKFLILDECHMLSKSAWNSWLKLIEEPPEHVYICFCTTELSKVPKTIQTRCHKYLLKDIPVDLLSAFVETIAENEKIELPKGAADLIAKESYGSVRQSLVFLSQVRNCTTIEEVLEIIGSVENTPEVVDLCKMLISRYRDLGKLLKVLKSLKESSPYSIQIQIMNYLTGCILNSGNIEETTRFADLLKVFDRQIDSQTGFPILTLCIIEIFLKKM